MLPTATCELGAGLLVVELTGGHRPSEITPRVGRALERKAGCEVLVVTGGGATRPVWALAPGGEALPA